MTPPEMQAASVIGGGPVSLPALPDNADTGSVILKPV